MYLFLGGNMIKMRLVRLMGDAKKYIFIQVLWQWLALLSQIVIVFSGASMISGIYAGTLTQENVIRNVVLLLLGILFRFFADRKGARASFLASVDVKKVIRETIYDKLLQMGANYRQFVTTADVVQMSTEGVEQLETYFGRYLPQFFYALLAPVTLFVVLAFVDLKVSAILLLFVPLIPMTIVMVQKIAKRLLNKYWGLYTELGDSFLENLQGLTTLKIYGADEKKAEEMDVEAERFRTITMKVLTMQLNSTSVMDILAYGGAAVGMVLTLLDFAHGKISLFGAISVFLLAAEFFLPMRILGSYFHIAMNGMAASDRIFAFLDQEITEDGTETLASAPISYKISNLDYFYGEKQALFHLEMDMQPGTLTAIVGESGCGKSTFASVLNNRNKGYEGSVCVNGTELRDLQETSYMEHVTTIVHQSYLFKGTVKENLLVAKKQATEAEMVAALKTVNLWDYLKTEGGLEFVCEEGANNLSGGQKQRLALARALLRDSEVYIFDEATSNIDVESEDFIMTAVEALAKVKTVILISHRLQNVVHANQIYFLEQGHVTEQGTHEELLAKQGAYAKLYETQQKLEQIGKEA